MADQKPIYGRMFQVQFAEAIRNVPKMATMAVGAITEPGQVNTIILTRRADLVALGRLDGEADADRQRDPVGRTDLHVVVAGLDGRYWHLRTVLRPGPPRRVSGDLLNCARG